MISLFLAQTAMYEKVLSNFPKFIMHNIYTMNNSIICVSQYMPE